MQPFPDPPFQSQDDFFDQNQFQPIQPITPDQIQPEVQPEFQLQPEVQVQPQVPQVDQDVQLQQATFQCDQTITGRNFDYKEGNYLNFLKSLNRTKQNAPIRTLFCLLTGTIKMPMEKYNWDVKCRYLPRETN